MNCTKCINYIPKIINVNLINDCLVKRACDLSDGGLFSKIENIQTYDNSISNNLVPESTPKELKIVKNEMMYQLGASDKEKELLDNLWFNILQNEDDWSRTPQKMFKIFKDGLKQ